MIRNDICPYCRVQLEKSENKPISRSVEHLVPNAALSKNRPNSQGDFYVCRKCNSEKSAVDYVIGMISKIQSDNSDFAKAAYEKAASHTDGRRFQFHKMECTKEISGNETRFKIPISIDEVIKYANFLGKGQYFKKKRRPIKNSEYVMTVIFANKGLTGPFTENYIQKSSQDPFEDLENNEYTESVLKGECLIWSKGNEYLFVFNRYTVLGVRVLRNNKKNRLKMVRANRKLRNIFRDEGKR